MMMDNGVMSNHYDGSYADGYMEQEEEWEREGLLDPAWEKQQKKRDERTPLPTGGSGPEREESNFLHWPIMYGGSMSRPTNLRCVCAEKSPDESHSRSQRLESVFRKEVSSALITKCFPRQNLQGNAMQ
uniref:SFRICE_003891 n=1 Tax=Spodoptera frugiperda TaxID=7108 RepID=A0A2H1W0Q2_SPOFR